MRTIAITALFATALSATNLLATGLDEGSVPQAKRTSLGLYLTAADAYEKWKADPENVKLIDVRTPQEYVFEHIAGALLLPMPYFKSQYLPFATDKQIVLYCGEGLRSEHCARVMLGGGSAVAAQLAGGFRAWREADKPFWEA